MGKLYDETRVSIILCVGWLCAQVVVVIFGLQALNLTTAVVGTLILLFVFITIFSLRVAMTREELIVSYGIGVFSRRIPLELVQGCEVVNNSYWTWVYDPMQEHVLRVKVRGASDVILGIGDAKRLSELVNSQRR